MGLFGSLLEHALWPLAAEWKSPRLASRAINGKCRQAASAAISVVGNFRTLEFDRHFRARANRHVRDGVLLAELGMPHDDVARAHRNAQIAERRRPDALTVNPHVGAVGCGDADDAF